MTDPINPEGAKAWQAGNMLEDEFVKHEGKIPETNNVNKSEEVITALPVSEGSWISVNDMWPHDGKSVLVTYNGIVDKTCMSFGEWLMPSKRQCDAITHWMPLPAPPKD